MVEGRVLFRDGTVLSIDDAGLRERTRRTAEQSRRNLSAGERRLARELRHRLTEHYRKMTPGEPGDT